MPPSQKLDGAVCPADDSHLTIKCEDRFVIHPSIQLQHRNVDDTGNQVGEVGKPVGEGCQCNSWKNHWFLAVDEVRGLKKVLGF